MRCVGNCCESREFQYLQHKAVTITDRHHGMKSLPLKARDDRVGTDRESSVLDLYCSIIFNSVKKVYLSTS